MISIFAQAHGDLPLGRRKVGGVGHQIVQCNVDDRWIYPERIHAIVDVEYQFQSFAQYPRGQLGKAVANAGGKVSGRRHRHRRLRFDAGQGQQLIDQSAGTINTGNQMRQ
ncbi:hypothetical protein D3C72_1927970 [compost metagenome]